MQIIRKQNLFLGQKYVDEITKYKIAKNTRDFKNFISSFCIAVDVVVVACVFLSIILVLHRINVNAGWAAALGSGRRRG